jgi:hypothetical protein
MIYSDGIQYEGEWKENDRDGYGVLISPYGFKFVEKYINMGIQELE